jgi:hypothetical protein
LTHLINSAHFTSGKYCNFSLPSSPHLINALCVRPFVTRQKSGQESISALTRCCMSRSIYEKAAMIRFRSCGRFCVHSVANPLHILVASEVPPCLLRSCVRFSFGATADCGSRGRGGRNGAEPRLAGDVQFRKITNVPNCSMWVFISPLRTLRAPSREGSFDVENQLLSETGEACGVPFRHRSENGFCLRGLEPAVTVACMVSPADACE